MSSDANDDSSLSDSLYVGLNGDAVPTGEIHSRKLKEVELRPRHNKAHVIKLPTMSAENGRSIDSPSPSQSPNEWNDFLTFPKTPPNEETTPNDNEGVSAVIVDDKRQDQPLVLSPLMSSDSGKADRLDMLVEEERDDDSHWGENGDNDIEHGQERKSVRFNTAVEETSSTAVKETDGLNMLVEEKSDDDNPWGKNGGDDIEQGQERRMNMGLWAMAKKSMRFNTAVEETPSTRSGFRTSIMSTERVMKSWKDKRFSKDHGVDRSATKMMNQNQWSLKTWIKYSLWTCWAIFLMLVLGGGDWAYPDGSNPTCPNEAQQNQGMNRNSATCGVEESLSKGSANLTFLSSFVLGGFLLSSRNLWLTRRSAYCALCGATRNLLINVTTLAPSRYKKILARWAVLGFELSVLKARSLIDSDEGRNFLELSRLVVGDEWESMVNGDRHTTVWYWVQSKAKQIQDQGGINEYELQTICNAVTLSRDKANDLMSCIDRDQPPPYVFVCAILININLLFHATAKGFEWAVWMHDAGGFKVFTEPRLYMSIVVLYLFTTIFAMLFDVCALLYNPFGPRDFDIKHNVVGRGIRQLGRSLSNDGECEPDTFDENVEHTSLYQLNSLSDDTRMAEMNLEMMVPAQNARTSLLPSLGRPGRPTFLRKSALTGRPTFLGKSVLTGALEDS